MPSGQRAKDVFLVAEMKVERAARQPRRLCDVLHRGATIAIGRENPKGRVQNGILPVTVGFDRHETPMPRNPVPVN